MGRLPAILRIRALLGRSHRQAVFRRRLRLLKVTRSGCQATQHRLLQELLRLNSGTQFARDFGLSPGMTLAEFRSRIPVAGYELVRPYIDRVSRGEHNALLGRHNHLRMFAVTSGTTAASKLIPVTDRFVSDYRRGWQCWGIGCYDRHPQLRYLNIIQISSSHRRFLSAGGTPCGNISGLVASMQSFIVRSLYSVPSEVAEIQDSESKRYAVLRCSVADRYVGTLITANPSTVLQMTELLQQRAVDLIRDLRDGGISVPSLPENLRRRLRSALKRDVARARELELLLETRGHLAAADVWPWLTVLGVWCGGSASAYTPQLQAQFPQAVIRDHGLHASEGRMTMPLEDYETSGVLEIHTHFFEFLPVREADSSHPVVLEAHELQEGEEYLILLTTSSGLYRYNIQDVVRCTGYYGETPLLEFRHKGAHISSITGEKVAESQVVEAVQKATLETGLPLRTFTLTPEWDDPPGYTLFVDLLPRDNAGSASLSQAGNLHDDLLRLARRTDFWLSQQNSEYREKRDTHRLRPVSSMALPPDAWQRFFGARTAKLGGSPEQYKHPCLLPDPQFQRLFETACGLEISSRCQTSAAGGGYENQRIPAA